MNTASEPLYDVINDRGLVLLRAQPHADAARIARERQVDLAAHPQWQGELRVVLARRDDSPTCRTHVVQSGGRLIVMCGVLGFVASGLTVAELFAKLRPQLEAAIHDAAARDPGQPRRRRPVVVQLDGADGDQSISLLVYDPAACAGDMDGHLTRIQTILDQALADQRTGGGL